MQNFVTDSSCRTRPSVTAGVVSRQPGTFRRARWTPWLAPSRVAGTSGVAYNFHSAPVKLHSTEMPAYVDRSENTGFQDGLPSIPSKIAISMRLNELISELDDLEPEEKLQWLVEFADELPAVSPEKRVVPFPESCRVQECQTPIHLWVGTQEGKIHLEADVPAKSPTVRGLVALVVCGLQGEPVSAALSLPDDMVAHVGLDAVLGMTRQQGFRGVIARIKRELQDSQPS
ncbi:SufE family protein [Schlesneria sp. DSM 10557]|uniref:SufE family protein n=1 Tax=Schlesneria sp. DSM 10557 TaxID=3044399 RepID=UPI0035A11471